MFRAILTYFAVKKIVTFVVLAAMSCCVRCGGICAQG